jgi:RNA polymerase sigma factor (TIGR02999 family)
MLNTTGLVHDTYLKLVDKSKVTWHDEAYFLSIAARAMRQIIVDYARRKKAKKRDIRLLKYQIQENEHARMMQHAEKLVALDEALVGLAAINERLVMVVECRFFAGYSEKETADILAVSTKTIQRDWKRVKAWMRELGLASARV